MRHEIARQSKKPKDLIFYGLDPLIRIAFQQVDLRKLPVGDLLDRLILQLRLTTLARSGELARAAWCIFHRGGQFFIRCTDKAGASAEFSLPPRAVAAASKKISGATYGSQGNFSSGT